MYVEANEPPLQYAASVVLTADSPAHDMIFRLDSTEKFEQKPNAIIPVGIALEMALRNAIVNPKLISSEISP